MATGNSQKTSAGAQQNKLALPEGVELGSYRLIRSLGQGGFGITYLAENMETGQQVVIKENLPTFCAMRDSGTLQVSATNADDELQEYPKLLTRFVEEARLLARLDHPNIVKVLDAFEALGTAYYVMPWLGGKELHKAAPAPATITEAWLQPHLRTLLGALQYLHANNIYHRDVKPGNILLTEDGTPVLIDFGTARAIISERSATLVGSPGYSPIEQMRAHGKRGPWTDIYSLGATCYRLIIGECTPQAFDRMDEDEDPLRPLANRAELFGRFSPAFLATVDRALALRGKDRWQSTDEWLAALPAPPVRTKTRTAQPVPHPATVSVTSIGTASISIAPEPAPRKHPHKALIVGAIITLVLALAVPGVYFLYEQALESARQEMRAELARQEAERQAREEAERKAREEAERKAREEAERKAREETERKAREEARSKLQEQGISESQYDKEIFNAAGKNDIEQLSLLIAAGADVNATNDDGYTPLDWAAVNTECVKLLLAVPGIDVNKVNKYSMTPLNMAALIGRTECVKLLLAVPGIDVNKADKYSMTPLNGAAWNGNTECVRLLLAVPGIDVNKANKDGYTPLIRAAIEGHSECVRLLLAAPGIDVNKADKEGKTPLSWAARNGHTECVRLLLAVPGINVNKVGKDGRTPLKAAEKNKHSECAQLLRQAGGR